MYDTLKTSYTFSCPIHGETYGRLSRFLRLFELLAPAATGDRVGVAVRCPVCGKLSVNLVSRAHVDVPFVNDRDVGVIEHLFQEDLVATVEEFRSELWSGAFDAR